MANKKPAAPEAQPSVMDVETVLLADLKPHPRNYRAHPQDQIDHLIASIQENGVYRPIVTAQDGTVLAGHGLILALHALAYTHAQIVRLPLAADDPRALKVIVADNEISNLVELDDRALTEILKEVRDFDLTGLIGTGFDDQRLANLLFITRPQSEIATHDAAAHWVGVPEYDEADERQRISVNFLNAEDRTAFAKLIGIDLPPDKKIIWWPAKKMDDVKSVRFVG